MVVVDDDTVLLDAVVDVPVAELVVPVVELIEPEVLVMVTVVEVTVRVRVVTVVLVAVVAVAVVVELHTPHMSAQFARTAAPITSSVHFPGPKSRSHSTGSGEP